MRKHPRRCTKGARSLRSGGQPVSVQVRCPHCSSLGLVSDEYLGVPVLCGTCKRSSWVRSPLAAPPGGAGADLATINATATAVSPKSGPAAVHFEVAGATSAGRVRKENEDSFLAQLLAWSGQERRG